jgi:hypothetical protein
MLYTKTSDLSITSANPTASLTLMSADIERITSGWQTMHEIWANCIEIAVAIYLLERLLGAACALPIGVAIGKFELSIEYLHADGLNSFCFRTDFDYQLGSLSTSNMARSNRKAHRGHNSDAWFHERSQDVRPN